MAEPWQQFLASLLQMSGGVAQGVAGSIAAKGFGVGQGAGAPGSTEPARQAAVQATAPAAQMAVPNAAMNQNQMLGQKATWDQALGLWGPGEMPEPPPSQAKLAGQELLRHPNVAGLSGGQAYKPQGSFSAPSVTTSGRVAQTGGFVTPMTSAPSAGRTGPSIQAPSADMGSPLPRTSPKAERMVQALSPDETINQETERLRQAFQFMIGRLQQSEPMRGIQ